MTERPERRRVRGLRDASGQALVEYALLVAAVATLAVSLTLLFGPSLATALSAVGSHISSGVDRLASSPPASGGGNGGSGGNGGNQGGNGNNGAPPPGNSPGSGNNPGVGNNPGGGNGAGSGNNPGRGRGL